MIDQRTLKQNKALHKYFRLLAETLNDAGLDMRKVMKPGIDIPWTAENVKLNLWKPIQEAMLEKESTTEMDTSDPSKVYDVLNRHLSEKLGIHVPWPHNEEKP